MLLSINVTVSHTYTFYVVQQINTLNTLYTIIIVQPFQGNSTIVSKILYPNETHRHGGPRGECYHKPRVDILRMYLFEVIHYKNKFFFFFCNI